MRLLRRTLWVLLAMTMWMLAPARALFEERDVSARVAALGGAFAAIADTTDGLYYNPAGLGKIPGPEFASTFTRPFGLHELQFLRASAAMPFAGIGTFGLTFDQFGKKAFRETQVTLGFGKEVARGVSLGIGLRPLQRVSIEQFDSANAFSVDLGITGRVHDLLSIGASARNLNNPTFGKTSERPPQIFRGGFGIHPFPGLRGALDLVKSNQSDTVEVHAGQEAAISEHFYVRAGIQTNPVRFSVGAGFRYKLVFLDYAFLSHQVLPVQHVVTFSIRQGVVEEVVRPGAPSRRPRGRRVRAEKVEVAPPAPRIKGKININTASEEQLSDLPGIGRITASRIVQYRKEHGPFASVEDLLKVPYFSKRVYQRIQDLVTVSAAEEAPPPAPEKEKEKEEKAPSVIPLEAPPEPEPEAPPEPEPEAAPSPAPPPPPAPGRPPRRRLGEAVEEEAPPPAPAAEPEAAPAPAAEPEAAPSPAPPPPPAPAVEKPPPSGPNFNELDERALQSIGFTRTEASNIVRYRRQKGPFKSWDDLKKVPGVRREMADALKGRLRLE